MALLLARASAAAGLDIVDKDTSGTVVRVVYLVPSDRTPNAQYQSVLAEAVQNFRSWLYQQLGDRTFRLHDPVVETYRTAHDATWYQGDGGFADLYYQTAADGFALAGGTYDDPHALWLFAVDADEACNQCDTCGAAGVAVLTVHELRGLSGHKQPDPCGAQPRFDPPCQWTGVLGHAIGLALGMTYPIVCQNGLPSCWQGAQPPGNSLSYVGYALYPNTYLLPADVAVMNASSFIVPQTTPPSFDCALIAPCDPGETQSCAGICSFSGVADDIGDPIATSPVVNGTFEECGYSVDGEPQGWGRWARYPSIAGFIWDDTEAHDGEKSIRISSASANDAYWSQTLVVVPNRHYRLSGWIKTSNVAHTQESVDAGANLSLVDTYTYSTPLFGTHDWQLVTLEFDSGSDTEVNIAARLGYSFGGTSGDAWFDGLRLDLVPPSPTPTWTVLPSSTPTSSPTPTETLEPTETETETPTESATPTATETESPTETAVPSSTPDADPSPTMPDSSTPTPVATATVADATPTVAEGATATPAPTPSATETVSSASATPEPWLTATPPATMMATPPPIDTETPTVSWTEATASPTPVDVFPTATAVPATSTAVPATETPSTRPPCPGDCDGDRNVTSEELMLGVRIALGTARLGVCPAFDWNDDGVVSIAEVVSGVTAALRGCDDPFSFVPRK